MYASCHGLARPHRVWCLVWFVLLLALGASLAPAGEASLAPERRVPARVELGERAPDLARLQELRLDIDGVFDGWARVYLSSKEIERLERDGFEVTLLPDEGLIGLARLAEEGVARGVGPGMVPSAYHTYPTLTQDLQAVAAAYPDIARLISIGQSVQGRELWMMKLSDHPDLEEDEPEIAYIAAMHGDEVVGKEMCFNLINQLTSTYGLDPRVTQLVDSTEIWIMPSMNPDGTAAGTRYNAQGIDLNRNFPDWFSDPNNTPDGRAIETGLVMAWTETRNIILSANFHGGALLINYPFDNNPSGSSVFSPTPDPDQATFLSVSQSYAENNLPMYNSPSFPGGVSNGAAWYAIDGGMQDWNYTWYGNFQVTAEISNNKWPSASQFPQFWSENQESMFAYFERIYEGVRGVVTDAATGAPVAATVLIDDNPFPSYTDPDVGDYHRVVLPGSYTLEVSAPGYRTQSFPITISSGHAARYDVPLDALATELQIAEVTVQDGLGGDGWLDPGETATLPVTLQNAGQSAVALDAWLEPATWMIDALQAEATFPDIPLGGNGESDAPHYRISIDPLTPVAQQVGFALHWQTADASGVTEPFFLDVGGPWCQTGAAVDVPRAIQDNQTATSEILIDSSGTVSDVRVPVNISHTYVGDLTIDLTSPEATTVRLHNRSGGGANNIVGTYGDDLTPAESLSVFMGESAQGRWRLDITDHANNDTGTLNAWSLEICDPPADPPMPEIRLREVSADQMRVTVHWWPYPGFDSYRVYRAIVPSSPLSFLDVTSQDGDPTDTEYTDASLAPLVFYLVTGVGPQGEGPLGHFGQ